MAKLLNLDAMIPREDFEVDKEGSASSQRVGKELKLAELEAAGITYMSCCRFDGHRV
jgi:hypothetical protein